MPTVLPHIAGFIIVRPSDQTEAAFQAEITAGCKALAAVTLGATVIRGQGYWGPTGQFEDNAIIYANTDQDHLGQAKAAARAFVVAWGETFHQQAVALIGDGLALTIIDL